jgi:class 3 adenylate cyclase/tetratricopeptide (TPR) repeat protein
VSRRLVVVLFLDLVGWTRLAERVDPEPLQLLLERYYEICSAAVEEHGGIVEKFIGDAIMAVFGAEQSSEEDAVRALRAAVRIRSDVRELPGPEARPVEIHCGVAAGEALVTRSPRAGLRVVGDVVNLAARLQSAAGAGEIIVNEIAGQLAGQHFALHPVPPLTLKGKAEPVPALRVAGPGGDPEAGDEVPLVDRNAERARLRAAFERVVTERRAATITVLGAPGIGKTRLVRDLRFRAVWGTCPSYGPNGTRAALLPMLDALTRQSPASRAAVRADDRLAAVLDGLRHPSPARRDGTGPGPGVEEVAWAARALLAAAAAEPLVVVWDSLEWAGPSLLRLIGELADGLRQLPVLMICVARPELLELGAPWIRGEPDEVLTVGALDRADSAQLAALVAVAGAGEVQAHEAGLLDRAGSHGAGNPLFIRLMVESAQPAGPGVPASITAMVGAMIDRLPASARELLGAASVAGSTFTVRQLVCLSGPVEAAGIDVLVRRQLIRATGLPGGYSFVQQPVHEVAYGRLDKHQRLAWHRLLADGDVSPAFHLEAAVRLLGDLRPGDAELAPLAGSAADALLREGTTALRQRDVPAAIDLLHRAMAVSPEGGFPPAAAIRLSDALLLAGDTRQAVAVVADAARRSPDARVRRACLVQRHLLEVRLGRLGEPAVELVRAEVGTDPEDRRSGCRFEQLLMLLHLGHGRFGAAERAAHAALEHARALGDDYEQDRLLVALCEVRQWSPTPIAEQLTGCAELADRFTADRFLLVPVLCAQARGRALTGDRAGAQAALAEAGAAVTQLRLRLGQVLVDQAAGLVCALEDSPAEAQRHFLRAAVALEEAGHAPGALTLRVQAARVRPGDGAGIAALLAQETEMDLRGRILCLAAAARLGAGGDSAEELIGAVAALLAETDDPCLRGDVYFDLARAHRRLGRPIGARLMAGAAIGSYAVAGATRPIRTVRAWL